jgi:ABC-type lipoprotein release transport system permease subunit
MLVLLVVVLAALLALGLLAVDERVREVGTLMSFGMRRAQLAAMFFWEGLFLGALGAALGLALSAAVTAVLGHRGIEVPHMGAAHPAVLRPALSLVTVAWGSALALFASACTGALVAWRVARLRPIEAARR